MSPLLRLALLASAAASAPACTSAHAVDEDANNGIYGSWTSTSADGQHGVRLELAVDRTYTLEELTWSAPGAATTAAEARVESGAFTAAAGTITWRPEMSSCRGAEAAYQSAYQLTGAALSLALPSDVVVLQAADGADADEGDAVGTGCFAADGTFTAQPLAAVAN